MSFSSRVTLVVNESRVRLNVRVKASSSKPYRQFKLLLQEDLKNIMEKAGRKAKYFIFLAVSNRAAMSSW